MRLGFVYRESAGDAAKHFVVQFDVRVICERGGLRTFGLTTARHRLKVWCRWVRWVARFHPSRLFASMVRAAETVEAHMAGILAYWKSRLTNAFMEGLNSVFSAVKRKARGYRSSVYLITMLYLTAGKLRLPQR